SGASSAAARSSAAAFAAAAALLRSLPRRLVFQLGTIGQDERRIPECVPALLVDALLRELDARRPHRSSLIHPETTDAGDDVIFGREVLTYGAPRPARFFRGELADNRRAVLDRITRAHLGAGLAVPRHGQHALIDARRETGRTFVLREIACEW